MTDGLYTCLITDTDTGGLHLCPEIGLAFLGSHNPGHHAKCWVSVMHAQFHLKYMLCILYLHGLLHILFTWYIVDFLTLIIALSFFNSVVHL